MEGSPLNVFTLLAVMTAGAILGDGINYSVGRKAGHRLLAWRCGKLVNPRHLARAQQFYHRHGGKTIVLARFVPIIRTFAPFVAGLAEMNRARFAAFKVCGAVVWVALVTLAGYAFGNVPAVKNNFHFVMVAIIAISLLPLVVEGTRNWISNGVSDRLGQQ